MVYYNHITAYTIGLFFGLSVFGVILVRYSLRIQRPQHSDCLCMCPRLVKGTDPSFSFHLAPTKVLVAGNHDYILECIGERNAQLLCKAFGVDCYLHTRNPPKDLHFKSGCKVAVPGPTLVFCIDPLHTDTVKTLSILEITSTRTQPRCSRAYFQVGRQSSSSTNEPEA